MPAGSAVRRRPTTTPAATISIRAMFTSRARATKSSLAFAAPLSIAETLADARAGWRSVDGERPDQLRSQRHEQKRQPDPDA